MVSLGRPTRTDFILGGSAPDVQALQSRVKELRTQVPFLAGHELTVTPSADGALTVVPHLLGRRYKGYIVTGQDFDGVEVDVLEPGNDVGVYAGAETTLAHSCGGVPSFVNVKMECTQAENGYAVGEILDFQAMGAGSGYSNNYGIAVQVTSTNIAVRCGDTGGIGFNNTSGGAATYNTNYWDLIFECHRPRRLQEVTALQEDSDPTNTDRTKFIYLRGHGYTGTDKVNLWVW